MRAVAVLLIVACYRESTPPTAPLQQTAVEQPRRSRAAADPLGFLPIDSELVLHLDVQQLRRSGVWARFEPSVMAKAGPAFEHFRALCGFELLPMIHTVALGLRHIETPQLGGVLVVRGIQRTPLLDCFRKAFARRPALGEIDGDVVTVTMDGSQPPAVFAFGDERTLVLASGHGATKAGLRAVLDAGAPLRRSPAFTEMFGRIDRRASWFFIQGTSKLLDSAKAIGLKPNAVFGSFDLTAGLVVKVFVRMANLTEAATFAQLAQSQIAPAVQTFVDKFEIVAIDADVVLDVALTDDQVALLVGLINP